MVLGSSAQANRGVRARRAVDAGSTRDGRPRSATADQQPATRVPGAARFETAGRLSGNNRRPERLNPHRPTDQDRATRIERRDAVPSGSLPGVAEVRDAFAARDVMPYRVVGGGCCAAGVFVEDVVPLPVPVGVARDRLLGLLERGGLRDAAAGAFADGQTVLLRAGFAGPTEQVAVRSLPPYRRGPGMVVLVRWVLTGPASGLFPPLDANAVVDDARHSRGDEPSPDRDAGRRRSRRHRGDRSAGGGRAIADEGARSRAQRRMGARRTPGVAAGGSVTVGWGVAPRRTFGSTVGGT